ncbi:MAG: DedA family protein [Firmicutes bacterium]|nr:DedA family protein [Bacillota bacterium]
MVSWLVGLAERAGPWAVGLAMALDGACLPLPSEMILPLGGYLASQGHVSLAGITLVANLGLAAGSLLAYLAGRWGGRPLLLRLGRWLGIGPGDLVRVEDWFARWGGLAVFACRFVPGLRTLISIPAGIAGMPLGPFLGYTFFGALPWTFAFTYAGFLLGSHWERLAAPLRLLDRAIWPLAALGLLGALGWRARHWRR